MSTTTLFAAFAGSGLTTGYPWSQCGNRWFSSRSPAAGYSEMNGLWTAAHYCRDCTFRVLQVDTEVVGKPGVSVVVVGE